MISPVSIELARGDLAPDVARILRSLPDWFGIPEAIDDYVASVARTVNLRASIASETVGFLNLAFRFGCTAEIHVMAVAESHHRRGIGRALVERGEALAFERGSSLLAVKTLGPSHPDPFYKRTRRFYESMGFLPLEEFPDLWPRNPCLILVKPLGRPGGDSR